MTPIQLELTRLIGKKDLTFGCELFIKNNGDMHFPNEGVILNRDCCTVRFYSEKQTITVLHDEFMMIYLHEIIGHPATLSDLHRWLDSKKLYWNMQGISYIGQICVGKLKGTTGQAARVENIITHRYNSSKDLLDQSEETLKEIAELIKSNS